MRSAFSKKQKIFFSFSTAVAVFLGVLAYSSGSPEVSQSSSVELGFSALSPAGAAGGEILPASCESVYRYSTEYGTWGNYFSAYDHTYNRSVIRRDNTYPRVESGGSYAVDKFINQTGQVYCFGNQGGPTYFVPTNTWAEFQTFWNAISRLNGMYIIPDLDVGGGSDG